jgi:hypothetical protein
MFIKYRRLHTVAEDTLGELSTQLAFTLEGAADMCMTISPRSR